MRTKLYSLMAWIACLTMASCTNQEIIEQAIKPVHSNTLNVVTEKQESRSVLSYEGTFYWTENDYIGVFGTETENARFHFTSQADGVSTFTGNMNASEEKVSWAYFPYSEKMDVSKKQLSFPMPAERTISNENHSPMIGRIETNNTVRFYHTGGILHLKIVGLPEHAAQLVIASEGENSPCLAGTAVIDDITADGCTYRIDNGSKEVVYDVRNLKGGEYIYSIYMPLQIDTYEKIKVTLKNEVGGIIKERSLSNLIVTRGKMTDTPTLHFSDKIYAYEVSKEYLSKTSWDSGILFSNDFFMACRSENIEGTELLFLNTFYDENSDDLKIIEVFFDKDDNIIEMRLGTNICYFSNYTENSFDLSILRNCTSLESYKGMKLKKKNPSRAMGTIDGGLEHVEQFNERYEDVSDVLGILGRESLSGGIGDARIDRLTKIVGHPMTDALVQSVGAIGQISEQAVTEHYNAMYNYYIGNTRVHTLQPEVSRDGNFLTIGCYITNWNELQEKPIEKAECGILIMEVENERRNVDLYYNTRGVQYFKLFEPYPGGEERKTGRLLCTPGATYVMRSYLLTSVADNKISVLDYGDYERITVPNCNLTNVRVEPCNFLNGYYLFRIRTDGYRNDDSNNCFTNLYRDLNLYESDEWNSNNIASLYLVLDSSEMDYVNRRAKGDWTIGASMGSDIIPYNLEEVNFVYEDPQISLNVQIPRGYPRKINNSRASDDDDEEKWIVKYEVTAKTKGSGWIEQVVIKESGHPVKTGNPKNEGESFTYTGSKTYKDKSELASISISCEGIPINGAGKNIQSVPASINVASKL